jgi:peroxiredoxin
MDINDKAPDFNSLDQKREKIALKDYKGKWVVLYFYPRADTPGCTKEACGFRDAIASYKELGVPVFGVTFGDDADRSQLDNLAKLTGGRVFDGTKSLTQAFRAVRGYN